MDPVAQALARLQADYTTYTATITDADTKADTAAKAKSDADAAAVTRDSAGNHVNSDKAALVDAINAQFQVPPAPVVPPLPPPPA